MIRLATDVGGTFTDLVGYDETTGRLFTGKCLTTVDDQSIGVLDAICLAARNDGMPTDEVAFFVHGGTTVINAVTERKGVKTALVTTAGFRDALAIGRGTRPDLYNLQYRGPEPFVPRYLRFEVRERLDPRGDAVEPFHEEDLAPIAAACRREDVKAVAIAFLHSYANPAHEKRCASLLAAALPGATICASHEVSRQWREYERSSTVVLNAYVQPIIERYFVNLDRALAAEGISCPTYAMLSNGGLSTFDQAIRQPLGLIESGPSGGVAGAACIGTALGESDVLYLDVGGTTAKCSLIRHGRPSIEPLYRLGHRRTWPGHPIQVPVVNIVEIGAGGGSIAWIDDAGGLRVGPESAGAKPGPACYDRGGTRPTVTDAVLVAGILDPATFAEGTLVLDIEQARRAIGPIAAGLGLSIEEAAHAVIEIAEANMINALKLVTIQRGHDPRDLVLVVSGGAGPALAARLGRELQTKAIVIPPHPGIFSAWGMLAARPRIDIRETWFSALGDDTIPRLDALFREMESHAIRHFGVGDAESLTFTRSVDMRYRGQEHSVATRFEPGGGLAGFVGRFHAAHETTFSFSLPGADAEVTTLHLEAELESDVIRLAKVSRSGRDLRAARRTERDVFFGPSGGRSTCPVYIRDLLPVDLAIAGPALIEEPTTTTLVLDEQDFVLTDTGILVVRARAR